MSISIHRLTRKAKRLLAGQMAAEHEPSPPEPEPKGNWRSHRRRLKTRQYEQEIAFQEFKRDWSAETGYDEI